MNFDAGNNYGKGLRYLVPNGSKATWDFPVFTVARKMQNGKADRLPYDKVRKILPMWKQFQTISHFFLNDRVRKILPM